MTSDASVLRNHCGRLFRKGVALQAGECLHADTMNTLVPVTVPTGTLIGPEEVEAPAMTYLAFKVKHEHMLCMPVGFPQCEGALGHLTEMTGLAFGPWPLSPVGSGELALSLYHVRYQKLVLLYKSQVVALLTDYIPVFTPLPFIKGFLHHVA